jgi:hypothetical protein
MKKGHDAVNTAENESGSAKHEKRDPTRSTLTKTGPGAQNIKTRLNALESAENKSGSAKHENSGSAKHENGTQRCWYRRKWVRERKTIKQDPTPLVSPKTNHGAQNMKTRPDGFGTAENASGNAKHENGTRRRRYRKKWVRGRKT